METLVLLGLMAQRDPPRPEVPGAVTRCHGAGIRPVMVTGDHPLTARAISTAIGLAEPGSPIVQGPELEGLDDRELEAVVRRTSLFARVLPEQKLRIVRALQASGAVVAMTGDGVNDAPALRQAHVGVAMGISGSDVSREAADGLLLGGRLRGLAAALSLARGVRQRIRWNLFWALFYNGMGLALAIQGLLTPVWAGLAMVLSSLTIVSNSYPGQESHGRQENPPTPAVALQEAASLPPRYRGSS